MVGSDPLLLNLCRALHASARQAAQDRKQQRWGDRPPIELLIMKKHHVRVEIRKEKVAHHEPHLHVVHSDKIDASLSLRTFEVLAGKIDTGTHRYFRGLLASEREKLLAIWQALNDEEDIATAHALIEDLAF